MFESIKAPIPKPNFGKNTKIFYNWYFDYIVPSEYLFDEQIDRGKKTFFDY